MTWVSWRLQTETLIAAAIFALIAAVLVPTGLHMASAYDHDGLTACLASHTFNCDDTIQSFTNRYSSGVGGLFPWFNLVPGIILQLFALANPGFLEARICLHVPAQYFVGHRGARVYCQGRV